MEVLSRTAWRGLHGLHISSYVGSKDMLLGGPRLVNWEEPNKLARMAQSMEDCHGVDGAVDTLPQRDECTSSSRKNVNDWLWQQRC